MINQVTGIYKITAPNGAIYIGQSYQIHKRWVTYKGVRCKRQIRLYRSLLKYGSEAHTFEIIHELPRDVEQEVLWEYEKLYIQLYKDCGCDMLNLNNGGMGGSLTEATKKKIGIANTGNKNRLGKRFTEESKRKISESRKGKRIPQESIDRMKKKLKGRVFTEEWLKKLSAWQIGRKLTPEHKEKLRRANIGKKQSEETRFKMMLSQQKRVSDESIRILAQKILLDPRWCGMGNLSDGIKEG